jgi:hypothetical protein
MLASRFEEGGGGSLSPQIMPNQLIPGMGGMNPTGSDLLNPTNTGGITATPSVFDSSGISGVPGGDNTLGGGSGVMSMTTPAPVGNIGGSVTDVAFPTPGPSKTGVESIASNVGLIPGTTTPSGFPANTAGTVGGAGQSGIGNLDLGSLLGFNANDPNMIAQLDNMFGKGVGAALAQFLGGGAGYNPAIGTALINQMAPQEERTRNQILESFGASGGRYSSPAAIGLADYESSYSLGQQGILANLANQATDRYSNLFGGLIDTAYLTQANKLSPWNIISGILGLAGSAGIKIPIPGMPGQTGPQGQPGKTGPAGTTQTQPQPPTNVSVTTGPQPNPTQTQTSSSGNWTDPSTGNIYDLNGNLIGTSGGYTGVGTQWGPLPGVDNTPPNLQNIPSGGYPVDYNDPFNTGQPTTPTIPIDSSTQYTDANYGDPGSFEFFDSWS